MKRLDVLDKWQSTDFINLFNIFYKKGLDNYIDFNKRNLKFPSIQLSLYTFDNTIKSEHYAEIYERTLDRFKNFKLTPYDEEKFKFDNLLDNYITKLNAKKLDIGKLYISLKDYSWKMESLETGINRYYREFFEIKNLENKEEIVKLNDLLYQYLYGFIWIFEYYFNSYDNEEYEYVSSWYYKYEKAPLFKHLSKYLEDKKQNIITEIQKDIEHNKIKRKDFFNCIEQLLFVTPKEPLKYLVSTKYNDMLENPKYYVDLDKIIKEIMDNEYNEKIIDCRGVKHLDKCLVKIKNKFRG